MKLIQKYLQKVRLLERRKHHPLLHKLHIKHGFSRRTLLYVKEYGPHTNVPATIIKESIKVLLLASILSSIGGVALENIKGLFISLAPLIILLPVLNNLIGTYGTIISARYTTLLHEGKAKKGIFSDSELRILFTQVMILAVIVTIASTFFAVFISTFTAGAEQVMVQTYKIFLITIIDVVLLVSVLFFIAVFAGRYFYRKGEDPDNFLIPITTSIADFGNMIVLAVLTIAFF